MVLCDVRWGGAKDCSYRDCKNYTDIQTGTTGNEMKSIKVAAHLLNWGVETGMTTDEIKKETISWLSDKGNSEQLEFSNKLASVYDAYQKLLSADAKELLETGRL